MASSQNTTSIPESITINGVTYSVKETPELQQFIQAVAKVEKTKLYSQMEAIKAQIQNLSNIEVEPTGTTDIDSIVEKLKSTFVTQESLKDTLSTTIKEVVQPVLDATQRNEQTALEEYREKIIHENESVCIPELVKGNTKEELDAALNESIRLRKAYPAPGTQEPKYTGDPNLQNTAKSEQFKPADSPTNAGNNPAPQAPPVPHYPTPEASSAENQTRRMSMAEFAKQREALRQNLESMYGNSSL